MSEPRTHIVFTSSAAQALREALAPEGGASEVLCLNDDFSLGPIGRTSGERLEWARRNLGLMDWRGVIDSSGTFLAAVSAATAPIIAWVSHSDSCTYAGFMWWLARAGPTEIRLADAATLRGGNHAEILVQRQRAGLLLADQRSAWQRRWRELEEQNAPFRVVDGEELLSAPIDQFDAGLLAVAPRDWQRMARIVGAMFDGFERTGIHQTSDAVLAARLTALAHDGQLEARGDLADMAGCEMRLAAR